MVWRSHVRYAQTLRHPNAGVLDAIEELIGCETGDKYVALAGMLRRAKESGLVTVGEYFDLREWLANEELG